jgi:TonB family protein
MRSRLTRPVFALGTSISLLCSTLGADQTHDSKYGTAVDARGVRHHASEYHGRTPPWETDRVKALPGPEYPYFDRRNLHQGSGLFRLTLDLRTGAVTNVAIIKSTGFGSLDGSTVVAARQWRWKPGKWKQIDTPVSFTLTIHRSRPLRGAPFFPHP